MGGFPSPLQRFALHAVLTDGEGEGIIDVVILRLETDEEVYSARGRLRFPHRLTEVRVLFRLGDCSFPSPGNYEAILLVDGEWVARRKFSVIEREAP